MQEGLELFYKYNLLFISSYGLAILLVYPEYSLISIGIQLILLNMYIYWIHRLLHNLPNNILNFHINLHHNKEIELPRAIELVIEFITNMSWFAYLILLQWAIGINYLSKTLTLFIGLWYSTTHIINYSLFKSHEHAIHHLEHNYNYGPPYMDYIFGTLKDPDNDTINYQLINGIIIFFILKLFTQ